MSEFKCRGCGAKLIADDGSSDYVGEIWRCPICDSGSFCPSGKPLTEDKIHPDELLRHIRVASASLSYISKLPCHCKTTSHRFRKGEIKGYSILECGRCRLLNDLQAKMKVHKFTRKDLKDHVQRNYYSDPPRDPVKEAMVIISSFLNGIGITAE